jgi:hypothetical protein
LTDATSTPGPSSKPRRWTIFCAALLLVALAVVVLYTGPAAFSSPLAVVVVAAIGLAAILLQLRLGNGFRTPVRAPLWLNVLGLVCAVAAVIADLFHLSARVLMVAALGAVTSFAVSGVIILRAMRKARN